MSTFTESQKLKLVKLKNFPVLHDGKFSLKTHSADRDKNPGNLNKIFTKILRFKNEKI